MEVVPENVYGPVKYAPPITHHIKLPSREGAAGIDAEIIFLALDDQKDVRKLLSLELTGAWVNEARELPVAVINGLSHRVGRFPSKADGGPTWRGKILDTNPMDDDHWYYRLAEKDRPTGRFAWKFFKQPGGVLPVPVDELPDDMPEAQGYIFQAGKWWKTNPNAENLHNLVWNILIEIIFSEIMSFMFSGYLIPADSELQFLVMTNSLPPMPLYFIAASGSAFPGRPAASCGRR